MDAGAGKIITLVCTWFFASLTAAYVVKTIVDKMEINYPLIFTFINCVGVAIGIKFFGHRGTRLLAKENISMSLLLIGLFTAVDSMCIYWAYSKIPFSAITVIKSSNVASTYICNIILGMEEFDPVLGFSILWICVSIFFTLPGVNISQDQIFACCVTFFAVIISSLKWSFVGLELKKPASDTIKVIYLTQFYAGLLLIPAVLSAEIPNILVPEAFSALVSKLPAYALLCVASILLICVLLIAEFCLCRLTSPLTLVVAGIGKECCAIVMSMVVFQEIVSSTAVWGVSSSFIGIAAYSIIRNHRQNQKLLYMNPVVELGCIAEL